MGKKGKFIEKGSSQKFHLVHRSQRDQAYENDVTPSQFVLIPATQNGNQQRDHTNHHVRNVFGGYNSDRFKRDHINELGLANDGYDYSQHLKEMGEGHFFAKPGVTLDITAIRSAGAGQTQKAGKETTSNLQLPDDVLPSANELERNLEAITISHECMDEDLHAALFEDCDEEGGTFEELDDDFVVQASQPPPQGDDTQDFDFDAHIARLLARSEQSLGINNSSSWIGTKGREKRLGIGFYEAAGGDAALLEEGDDDNDDDEDDDDRGEKDEFDSDEEFPDYLVEDLVGDFQRMNRGGRAAAAGSSSEVGASLSGGIMSVSRSKAGDKSAVAPLSAEQRRVLEEAFDRTLDEYGDDAIGYLSGADEEELEGSINLEHLDGDDYSAEGSDASNRSSEVCEGAVAEGIGAGIGDYAGTGAVSAVQDRAGEGVGKKDKAVSKEALGMEAVLEAALEEFIQEEKDNLFVEGTQVRKGARSIQPLKKAFQKSEGQDGTEDGDATVDVKRAAEEQWQRQQQSSEELLLMEADKAEGLEEDLATCQEYLRDEREQEEWDCETILSTYSTLDNHPTVIKDVGGKFRPYKSRHARKLESEAEAGSAVARSLSHRSAGQGSLAGSASLSGISQVSAQQRVAKNPSSGSINGSVNGDGNTSAPAAAGAGAPQIVLAGRLHLPEGFGPARYERNNARKKGANRGRMLHPGSIPEHAELEDALMHMTVVDAVSNREEREEGGGDDYDCEEDDDEGSCGESEASAFSTASTNTALGRNKHETAEEKRRRKALVKEERRQKRNAKRELRAVYKAEGSKVLACVSKEQSIDHVSVFKYT